MNRKNVLSFVAGVLAAVLLGVVAVPAFAAYTKTIEVYPNSLTLFVDDVKLEPKDVNGNPVDIFVYNGTTYVPIRAVTNAFGKPVYYDGKAGEVYLGKHNGDKPSTWLKDLEWHSRDGELKNQGVQKDNLNNAHADTLDAVSSKKSNWNEYDINGNYTAISGTLFQVYDGREIDEETTLNIYGDGELLYTATVRGGPAIIDPISFKVDITGVLKLRIELYKPVYNTGGRVGDLGLWS